jgi:predicted regulator of Ras-like GTPase activity (Roadblock/LC7/MglB family)
MDAEQALADLIEISSQIEAAVIFDADGKVAGSTLADAGRAEELARRAGELLHQAAALRGGDALPNQLEVATREGSVFVARDADARIVATTSPQPTVGLVFYDLKSALRQIEQAEPAPPKRRRRAKPAERQAEQVEATANAEAAEATPTAADEEQAPKRKRAPRKKADAP